MAHEFEKLEEETPKAFAAFSLYLSLGAQRSTAEVARKLAKSEQLIRRWCARHRWVERTEAYVRHIAEVERESQTALVRGKSAEWLKRQEEEKEDEWKVRRELMEAGRKCLERFRDGSKGATLGDVARALEIACKLGRLATGMATDRTEVEAQMSVGLSPAFEAMLKKIYSEPNVPRTGEEGTGTPIIEAEIVQVPALNEGGKV